MLVLAPRLGTLSLLDPAIEPRADPPSPSGQTCSPLPVFGLVATKDVVILPRLYATLFGNPLDALTQGEALLSEGEQAVLLVLLAGWLFVRAAREEGEELDGGRERWKEG